MIFDGAKIPVSDELRKKVNEIHESQPGGWHTFVAKCSGDWPGSWGLAYKVGTGRQTTTDPAVYEALGVEPPATVVEVHLAPGTHLVGSGPALLDVGQWTTVADGRGRPYGALVIVPAGFEKYLARCAEPHCETPIIKSPPNRKRCPACSAATPAARRLTAEAGICVAEVSAERRVLAKDVKGYIKGREEKKYE